nr:hypothetical protein [Tanacetum cinerariifolium]
AKYTLEILHKHGMDKGQSIGTPMATKPKLDANLSGNPVDQTDYRSKIGSLMYLTSSRPDILQAGCSFGLTAFSDADHAGCIDSRKSTSGGIQFLGDKLVSWMSKKQNCTAMSSAKAKYVALSASYAQVMWMRTQLQDYGFNYNKIPLYCDSQDLEYLEEKYKMMNDEVHSPNLQNTSPSEIDEPCEPSPRMDTYEQPLCFGSTFNSETLRKSDQMHQTFKKSSIAMTRKLDDVIELPKSQPKRTYNKDLECKIVMVKMPKCKAWLDDEPIGNLDTMED